MPRETIGNPLSWSAQRLAGVGRGLGAALDGIGSHETSRPEVKQIGLEDIRVALRKGAEDFAALRTDVIFVVALYPLMGFVLAFWAFNSGQVHLLFPLIAGFPLVGPVAAIGLYEMSRRRERGEATNWGAALATLTGRVLGPVLVLGLILAVIFVLWLYAAHLIWAATMGPVPHDSIVAFLRDTLTTPAGWEMILIGMGVGFLFAALVLCLGLVSFPLLIDRPVGVQVALATSLAVARRNPGATALWGLIVAGALVLGTIPLFVGLIVVLPILGHATWHLYRRAVL
ncbi:DUF2189 domain-containing protein [Paracoccus siganidrum]|uniref:DUF2189 domain-containing protein n=1 Tax=Paracoccus siganidrum TaxID=1276757 RepID=A0A419A7I9_9RHOB|nr:DUF2189 domain-containing protein [Paracoccus siganidrum]RJL16564.1 DUF2189 domain-containing protein [Paracoccus siganidrum]RMC29491.1 hypothetical protein C9E82_20300 [Paracoccus siganidrum]